MAKHKKLKKKYQNLQNDIYVDEDELVETKNDEEYEPSPKVPHPKPSLSPQRISPRSQTRLVGDSQHARQIHQNWRSQLTYL